METTNKTARPHFTQPYIEIMDCTLRDGEQTSGVSFLPHEKLMIARKLLGEVNVDRIEVASARVSEGEKDAVRMICRYADSVGKLDRVEVLGFVDGHESIDWIADCGGRVINLLAKGSLKHSVPEDKVRLVSYMVSTSYGLKPLASIKVNINGEEYEDDSTGDGQYDAFVKALRKIYKTKLNRTFPLLENYNVTIPPGGRTDALVQTVITWRNGDKLLRTRGLDADQTESAIKATFKMLNMIEDAVGETCDVAVDSGYNG